MNTQVHNVSLEDRLQSDSIFQSTTTLAKAFICSPGFMPPNIAEAPAPMMLSWSAQGEQRQSETAATTGGYILHDGDFEDVRKKT